ncbi:hypothetical protein VD0004_g115 [Verticillium dahliae]|nr:hypothetical protein VD0004_g115 [Verticillium dahliae]
MFSPKNRLAEYAMFFLEDLKTRSFPFEISTYVAKALGHSLSPLPSLTKGVHGAPSREGNTFIIRPCLSQFNSLPAHGAPEWD